VSCVLPIESFNVENISCKDIPRRRAFERLYIHTGLSDDDGSTQKSIVIDLEIDDESTLSEFLHTGVQTTRMLVVGARFWLSKQINCSYS
jgi:hypothetical protein